MHSLQYALFQGEFSQWLHKSPLLFTDWLQQSHNLPRCELSVYTIPEGTNESKHSYRQINNMDAKCAAIHIGVNLQLTWIAVHCDQPFEATFLCQKPITREPVDFSLALNLRNATCQDGWIQVKGVVNCQNSRDKGPPEGNSARG